MFIVDELERYPVVGSLQKVCPFIVLQFNMLALAEYMSAQNASVLKIGVFIFILLVIDLIRQRLTLRLGRLSATALRTSKKTLTDPAVCERWIALRGALKRHAHSRLVVNGALGVLLLRANQLPDRAKLDVIVPTITLRGLLLISD